MRLRRLRIADLLLLVVAAALGISFFRGAPFYERADLTYLLSPLVTSAVLTALIATAIAAGVGQEDRRAARWGFVLGCGAYTVLTWGSFFDASWTPVASRLAKEGLGAAGLKAGSAGWASAADLVRYLGLVPSGMMYG